MINQYLEELNDLEKRIQWLDKKYEEKLKGDGDINIKIEQLKVDISRDEQQRAQLQMDVKGLNEEMTRQFEDEYRTEHLPGRGRDEQIRQM